jgi:ATP-dependent Zn protease
MKKVICTVLFVILIASGTVRGDDVPYLTYEEFIGAVESGQVKQVQVGGYSSITGIRLVDGQEKKFESFKGSSSAEDPLLLRFLKERGVSITIAASQNPPFWESASFSAVFGLMMFLVPILTFIFVVLVYLRMRKLASEKQNTETH